MRLARLELHGFKSFPDRTTFHFGAGVSCVVGPNGSGKSNVVDALKWCVGEQSAKSLRGSEMTDVIFAGSTERKPVGFAEVVLTLATDDAQPFTGEYAALREVQVGRRLHRSGTSEYTINQTKVRRRDVIELLLDSGIGNDLYSFIEQGQVDKMISATPQERRSLIDEAAGISRYKARRDEAQERLEATAAQLDRAADVVDEMARHLHSLEAQVLKAAEFRRHGALIRLGELRLALAKHLALVEDRAQIRAEMDALRGDELQQRQDVADREQDLARRRDELAVLEDALAALRDRLAELDGAIREGNATASLNERRATELRGERTRAVTEADRQVRLGETASAEIAALDQELAAIELKLAALGAAEAEAATAAADAQAELDRARAGRREAEEAIQGAMAARMGAQTQLGTAERAKGERELQIASLEADLAEQRAERVRAGHGRAAAGKAADEASTGLAATVSAVSAAEAALAEAREAEAAARGASEAAERAREAALGRQRARERERSAALERGRQWIAAAERRSTEIERAEDRAWARRIAESEARGRQAATEARKRAEAEAASQAAALEAEVAARRTAAEQAVGEASRGLGAARTRHAAAQDAHARAVRSRSAVDAELGEVRRQLEATAGAGKLVRRVVPDARTLAELAPEALRADWVARLGDRAGWAVVRTAQQLSALAAARPADATVQVVVWAHGAPSPAEGVQLANDLGDAVASGAWPAAGPGFRIEVGGFVTLGPPGALERAVAAEQALAVRATELEAQIAAAAAGLAIAESEVREVERTHAQAVSARDVAVREALDRLEGARASRARAIGDAEDAARRSAAAELEALQAAREQGSAASRSEHAAALDDWRAVLQAAEAAPAEEVEAPIEDPGPLRAAAAAASGRTEAARAGRERAMEVRLGAQRAKDAADAKVTAADAELARIDLRIADCERQIADRVARRTDDAALVELRLRAEGAASAEEQARARFDDHRGRSAVAEATERAARDRANAIAVERAGAVERAAAIRDRKVSASKRVQEAAEAAARSRSHAEGLADQAASADEARRTSLAEVASAQEQRGELWDRLEHDREHAASLAEARDRLEQELREARTSVERSGREMEQLTTQHGKIVADLEVLRGRIDDRYQLSLPNLLERLRIEQHLVLEVDPDVQEGLEIGGQRVEGVAPVTITAADLRDEKRVRAAVSHLDAHRQALGRIGEVNLAAPQEYRELRSRHDELAAQRFDLEQSVDGIRAAIAKLNRMCRERFRETFDRVNEYFTEVYPRLVGGGSARLALTDQEDLLETGVEIFVQPPGKRLQNLQLLSGGEKAMTAIALLIALFRVKPSPFCVLDEVDAPLDEANGARFNEMLKEMALRSQFLVITHNRKTMECADTLYGITMAKPGVSRLVSVDVSAW